VHKEKAELCHEWLYSVKGLLWNQFIICKWSHTYLIN